MPFRDIAGHRPILKLLASAIARESLPQSLLFNGPEGVGKAAVALAVAQAVNCTNRSDDGDSCGTCASCSRIARGVHGDVILVEPGDTGSIKIEQVRDALEHVSYRPFEGRRRVVIIDRVETAGGGAQDALLKRLEEPTSASMFILISSQCDLLLPTVRSRLWNLEIMPVGLALAVKFFGRRQDAIRKEWNLSGGNAGLLSGLIEQAQRHPLAEAIAEAKELLTTDAFHRLTMADKFSFRPRPQNADLLQALQKILAALHHNAVKQNKPALARRLAASRQQTERAARRLEASANQKLLLTDLLLKI